MIRNYLYPFLITVMNLLFSAVHTSQVLYKHQHYRKWGCTFHVFGVLYNVRFLPTNCLFFSFQTNSKFVILPLFQLQYINFIYVCMRIAVSNKYCVVFLFCLYSCCVLRALCCQFLLIVHLWSPLRYSQ